MKRYNDWQEIERDTGGLVTPLVYVVLFINDQVYNHALELHERIRRTPYYRHDVKRSVNELARYMDGYNTNISRVGKANINALAIITQSMEDDIKPHIDRYGFAVSQALHGAGCHGDLNSLLALASTIDMLCQTSAITIRDFYECIRKLAPLACNPLEYLSVDRAMHLTGRITGSLTPRSVQINLNDLPEIATAFQAIANGMLRVDVFKRAFDEAEKGIG